MRHETGHSPEEIRFLLNRMGWTFANVDREYNLKSGTAKAAARYPHMVGERAISAALKLFPHILWPKRYDQATGLRLKPQPSENYKVSARYSKSKKQRAA